MVSTIQRLRTTPAAYVTWAAAGVELFDDGNNGDTAADDGIYSRLWVVSTDGVDPAIEPGNPAFPCGRG